MKLIREDLYRYGGRLGWRAFLWAWWHESGFRLSFLMRFCRLLRAHQATRYGLYHIIGFFYHQACVRHGVHIDFTTEIGGGLFIPHALSIVVNKRVRIGRNCSLSQGVNLGIANRGKRCGTPVIGENVHIGPGAVIFGAIHVSDRAVVGANCVVTKDVPEMGVVEGIPGKVISLDGSLAYVNLTLDSTPTP